MVRCQVMTVGLLCLALAACGSGIGSSPNGTEGGFDLYYEAEADENDKTTKPVVVEPR